MASEVSERLARVNDRIHAAAARACRSADEVRLIAVSKTVDAVLIQQAVDAGIHDFGENKVQEAVKKAPAVTGAGLRWHLIGHLQSNKVRIAVTTFDFIHTVDSAELVKRLDRIAAETGRRPSVLVQLKLTEEPTKSGADEEFLPGIIESLDAAAHLDFKGLMGIGPADGSAEDARPYFKKLRSIFEGFNSSRTSERKLTELSMGMSNDFEVAIEEGATMIRVGTAIFGPRQQ